MRFPPVLNSLKGFSIPSVKSDFSPFVNDKLEHTADASYIHSVQELTTVFKGDQNLKNPFLKGIISTFLLMIMLMELTFSVLTL